MTAERLLNILVVEDDMDTAEVLAELLGHAGYRAVIAANAAEACRAWHLRPRP
ncbi:MAG: hypothetical protein IPK52_22275 [Chloroflexi bacterium]|nr:hypothetical protein [Chloroflexota bacterium]